MQYALYSVTTFLLIFLGTYQALAAPGDTTKIRVHDAVDMVWYESYDRPVTFPSTSTSYSKILMHYTMGCASTGCSDWDYTTKIELLNPLGLMDSTIASIDTVSTSPLVVDTIWNVFEVKEAFELARVITPYGSYMRTSQNGYSPNWKHVHTFDVTDYYPLLQGSKEIRAFYGGWSSGFSVTIDFEFIEGTPPREVLSILNLWQTGENGWNYQNATDFEQNYLSAKTVNFPQNAKSAKLRFIPSGHGFDNSTGCAEFCQKHYYLKVDGVQVDSKLMWDDKCGLNPIFPQGGTWLLDRANWCPGSRVHAFDYEFPRTNLGGTTKTIDIDIENISWSGTQAPNYILESQLFLYGENSFNVDLAIEDILSPSLKDDHKRLNPVCNSAKIQLKNYGKEPITSALITYAVNGNLWRNFTWTGHLPFDQTVIVDLPLLGSNEWVANANSTATFEVKLLQVNGSTDQNALNNRLTSQFKATPRYGSSIELQFRTNSKPAQTTWQILNDNGDVVKQNRPSMVANTLYRDTVELQPGCYYFYMKDSQKNGLSYWANNDGSGSFRLRTLGGSFFHTFTPDFGTEIKHHFTVGYTLNLNTIDVNKVFDFHLFPNPTSEQLVIELESELNEVANLIIYDAIGKVIKRDYIPIQAMEKIIDVSELSVGSYLIKITGKHGSKTKKFIKQ